MTGQNDRRQVRQTTTLSYAAVLIAGLVSLYPALNLVICKESKISMRLSFWMGTDSPLAIASKATAVIALESYKFRPGGPRPPKQAVALVGTLQDREDSLLS